MKRPSLQDQYRTINALATVLHQHTEQIGGAKWTPDSLSHALAEYAENNPGLFTPGVFNQTAIKKYLAEGG